MTSKYAPQIAWRTLVRNVFQLTRETINDAATYRCSVAAIDTNDVGAGQKEIGYYLVDHWGVPYLIVGIGSGYIDVQDDFRVGRCPTSGMNGVVYKSVYNGRALYLAPDNFRHLHPMALQNSHKYEMGLLWSNDPNAKKVPFTAQVSPGITNYQDDQVDPEDAAKTINYAEDFGDNPLVRLIVDLDGVTKFHTMQNALFTYDGLLLQSFNWDIGSETNGYILISKA